MKPWVIRGRSWRRPAAVGIAFLTIAAACSGDDDEISETTPNSTTTTTTIVAPASEDGLLKLGVILPINDSLIGEPLLDAVRRAVTEVNTAEGILGRPVQTFIADEGTTAASAAAAVDALLEDDVDAIVGPASSLVALNVLADLVDSNILTCSPTGSALSLDDFPDQGLFFRTIPSDSMQAGAIAEVAEDTGALTTVIAYIDDSYGRPFAEATATAFEARPISLLDMVPFLGQDDDFSEEAQLVVDSAATVVVVIGTGEDTARFLAALDQAESSGFVRVIVNGDVRTPGSQPLIESLDPDFRDLIVGVGAQAQADPNNEVWDPDGLYATNAYDCVNLIALSALVADSTNARDLAAQIPDVSTGGSVCNRYEDCLEIFQEGLNFNYNGPTGVLEIERSGNPTRARFISFDFDEGGQDVWRSSFVHPG